MKKLLLAACLAAVFTSGCGEGETEDYAPYTINIMVGENSYEAGGLEYENILDAYKNEERKIISKEKIQVVLQAERNISYTRVMQSINELKVNGVPSVGLGSSNE